jgi:hypothetical protein
LQWKPDVIVLTNYDFPEFQTTLLLPEIIPVVVDGDIVDFAEIVSGTRTYTIKPEYLLYLTKHDGNIYAPVTGMRYGGLSVRIINK